ncbi:hypothetical protein [Rosenbergiella australiborealis]|uniref:hypothetical protein n=1 Tax=Rosenbergiella australiborealis TaxID=1544696 RepID=UPI001F4DBBA2|nr:hypothetical protein [Rosenbergiella australiborealis]
MSQSFNFLQELKSNSKKYLCVADTITMLSLKLVCDPEVSAELILSRLGDKYKNSNPNYFGKLIGLATLKINDDAPLLVNMLEDVITGNYGNGRGNIFDGKIGYTDIYWEYAFEVAHFESDIGFNFGGESSNELPNYLKPYKSRVGIPLSEAANLLAGFKPKDRVTKVPDYEIVDGYLGCLWDAVENNILSSTDTSYGYDNEGQTIKEDTILSMTEIDLWAKEHEFRWPFHQSAQGEMETTPDLEELIHKLKLENNELRSELEKVKAKLPSLLQAYRQDDPLLIAIHTRNDEWQDYNEDIRNTIPSAEYVVEKLKTTHKMSEALAKAIEKVACPITR